MRINAQYFFNNYCALLRYKTVGYTPVAKERDAAEKWPYLERSRIEKLKS